MRGCGRTTRRRPKRSPSPRPLGHTTRNYSRRSAAPTPPNGGGRRSGTASRWRPTYLMPRQAGSNSPISSRPCSPASTIRAPSSAASAPPVTRLCTRTHGTACRRRRSSRVSIRRLAELRDRLYDKALPPGAPAGALSAHWAREFKLREGIAIAMGGFDAHYGAVGSGIRTGTLVKIIGTSTCDCAIAPTATPIADVPGICGIVNGSIMPGYYGIEAGQSAVGDLLKWWVEGICQGDDSLHASLSSEAAALKPGEVWPRRARLEQRQSHDSRRHAPHRSDPRPDAAHDARRDLPRVDRGYRLRRARHRRAHA